MRFYEISEKIRSYLPKPVPQAKANDPKPKAQGGRTKHPFHGKLVGDSIEHDGEQLDEAARIQHAEDIIFWEGSKGAVRALESLKKLANGGHEDVTIKWDGSPAVIFGRDEVTGEFILTDKSGFGAKGYDGKSKSGKELQAMLHNRKLSKGQDVPPDYKKFARSMSNIFDSFEQITPRDHTGFFKGDLLYFDTPKTIRGDFVFKPNMVTYTVPIKSELGQKIKKSKAGIVIHNEVAQDGSESPLTINAEKFFGEGSALVFPPVTVTDPPKVNTDSIKQLEADVNKSAQAIDSLLNKETLQSLKISDLPQVFYTYTNRKVDSGMVNLGKDFLDWLSQSKVSQPKQERIREYIDKNKAGFVAMWTLVKEIQDVKDDIINQFDSQESNVKANIGDIPGGEGYVLSHDEGPIKLVNRAGFTAANRAAQR
jgi:hypothetical protein